MKRKLLITILCLAISISMIACGNVNTSEQQEVMATEQTTETEIIEETQSNDEVALGDTQQYESTEMIEQSEITDNIVYPDVKPEDVDPKTTNMDADTAFALGKKEGAEIDDKYGSEEAWTGYAQSQGADGTMGWCWVYYTGQGAGSEESYAVYMKEGSPRYGEVFHLGDYLPGGTLFTGYNSKEMGIADDREFERMYENGEFGDGLTIDEDGTIIIN